MPKDLDISSYRTIAEVSAELELPSLRRLVSQGRVPFIIKVGCCWYLPPQSRAFLKKHLVTKAKFNPHGRAGFAAGQIAADKMRSEAAQLDPACKARQAAWFKRYPNGEHNGAKKKSGKSR